MKTITLFSLVLSFSTVAFAESPNWTRQDTLLKVGSSLTLVCQGRGPTLELARADALRACRSTAADRLTNFLDVKSTSVETETDAGVHVQIQDRKTIQNLECIPKNEYFNESKNDGFEVWSKCEFDLSKAKVTGTKKFLESKASSLNGNSSIEVENIGSNSETREDRVGNRIIFLSVVPPAENILIEGSQTRIVQCSENPCRVVVSRGDANLTVRARTYQSKVIPIQSLSAKELTHEVDVVLNPR